MQPYLERFRPTLGEVRRCPCGAELPTRGRGRPRKWCPECAVRQRADRERGRRRVQLGDHAKYYRRRCIDCGQETLTRRADTCEACYQRRRYQAADVVACPECGGAHKAGFSIRHPARRLCPKCGVNEIFGAQRLCDTCPRANTHKRPGRKANTTQRGYGRDYQMARAKLLADRPPCHWCGAPATTADHVPPIREVGPHLNLVPACTACNVAWHKREPKKPFVVENSRRW